MKRLKESLSSRLGFSLMSNFITVMLSLFLFRPFWEESDDVGMALIAEGAYGYNEPHLLYANIIYGKILCFFQSILPAVRWHAVVMYFFSFVVSVAFVYILSKTKNGRVLSIVFQAGVLYELYVSLQFSKIAVYVAMLALIILFEIVHSNMEKKEKRFLFVIATLCAFYSMILRIESFYLAALIAGSYGICLVIYELKEGEFIKKIGPYCKAFIPVFVILVICLLADKYSFSKGGWKNYKDYYNSVTQMVDYHNKALLYGLHGDELKSLGVSENDALMYITYESLEVSLTTLPLMDRISLLDPKGIRSINVDFLKAWIANIYEEILTMNSVVVATVLLMGLLVASMVVGDNKRYIAVNVMIQIMLSFFILFYYQYSSRWCHRIVYALLIAQLTLFVYLLFQKEDKEYDTLLKTCIFLMIAVSILTLRLGNEFSFREYERSGYDYNALIEEMKNNKDVLYVADVFTMIEYGKYDVFSSARKGQFDNLLQTDSVFVANSPVNEFIAAKYGYADPFEALSSGDDKVILVDNISPDVELTFLNEHGDKKEYRLIDAGSAGNINLYKISN